MPIGTATTIASTVAKKPAWIDARAPQISRESSSRPSSSVPSRCFDDECASSALKSVAPAPYGASSGAKIAVSTKTRTMTRPATAIGRRRNRLRSSMRRRARGVHRSATRVDGAHARAPGDADPRIQQRVDDVDREIDDHVAGRGDEHDALDQRVVALVDGLDRERAEAGDPEDRLRDDDAGDQRAELQADHSRDGDQAVAQRVPPRSPSAR